MKLGIDVDRYLRLGDQRESFDEWLKVTGIDKLGCQLIEVLDESGRHLRLTCVDMAASRVAKELVRVTDEAIVCAPIDASILSVL